MHAHTVGTQGEDIVANWLLNHGFRILDRNIWYSFGEIDILAKSSTDELCIVEVKSRSSEGFGTPGEAITAKKRHCLRRCVRAIERQYPESPIRVLVAEVIQGRLNKLYQDSLGSC